MTDPLVYLDVEVDLATYAASLIGGLTYGVNCFPGDVVMASPSAPVSSVFVSESPGGQVVQLGNGGQEIRTSVTVYVRDAHNRQRQARALAKTIGQALHATPPPSLPDYVELLAAAAPVRTPPITPDDLALYSLTVDVIMATNG